MTLSPPNIDMNQLEKSDIRATITPEVNSHDSLD